MILLKLTSLYILLSLWYFQLVICIKKPRVNNKRSFIDNPYLLLATRFVYNYTHTLSIHFCNNFFVKRESTSKLTMKSPGSWSAISLANSKLFLTAYILVVIGSRRGTRNLATLYVGVLIAEITGLKGGMLSNNCLWTLQSS